MSEDSPLYITILAEIINLGNRLKAPAEKNDVTVVGAGIHALIYAIHAQKVHPDADLKIAVFEKAARPQWKVCPICLC